MLKDFADLNPLLKTDSTFIDNITFRLHYKASMFILVACSFLLTQKQYFGDPIDCYPLAKKSNYILDPYCWIHDTYTIPSLMDKRVGRDVVAAAGGPAKEEDIIYHTYYQWVTFFVYLQVGAHCPACSGHGPGGRGWGKLRGLFTPSVGGKRLSTDTYFIIFLVSYIFFL